MSLNSEPVNLIPVYAGGAEAIWAPGDVADGDLSELGLYRPGGEELADGEIRVSILGSGQPWVTRSQAASSVLMEVGNPERDVFVFDVGAGSLTNFSALKVPVTSLTKVFFTHLHIDHVGDFISLMGGYARSGRLDPVEVWGGSSPDPQLGTAAFVDSITKALSWDVASVTGSLPTSGLQTSVTEVPYDRSEVIYDRNGVQVTSFPVIHALEGAVGYRLDYAGRSVVFSGDTVPARTVVEASEGCDLLIHETFLPPAIFSELMRFPLETAELVVNTAHTSALAAGVVFDMVQPRMAAMWHCHVVDGYIEPVFEDVRRAYSGPATLCQDLTVFNVTADSITARQTEVDWAAGAVIGPSETARRVDGAPPAAPAWWDNEKIDWRASLDAETAHG